MTEIQLEFLRKVVKHLNLLARETETDIEFKTKVLYEKETIEFEVVTKLERLDQQYTIGVLMLPLEGFVKNIIESDNDAVAVALSYYKKFRTDVG